jgi:hypothetical protein
VERESAEEYIAPTKLGQLAIQPGPLQHGIFCERKRRLVDSQSLSHIQRSLFILIDTFSDAPLKFLKQNENAVFEEAEMSFGAATFGDYQAVRMRIIHEKFDSDFKGEGPVLDPKFVEVVRNLGVAHGTGVTFEGTEPTAIKV